MAISPFTHPRLKREYMDILKEPVDYVLAHPLEENILVWHYVIRGPKDSSFFDGIYHGNIIFPKEYPFKPPSFYMFTPNGRFECNKRLCLTMSDYHPRTWSAAWTVSTLLKGLLSFMLEENSERFVGYEKSTVEQKKKLAQQSWAFNLNNAIFCKYFPDLANEAKARTQS